MAQEYTGRHDDGDGDQEPEGGDSGGQERRDQLDEGTDTILDEIDDVLEEHAGEVVRAYVQKGGQ